MSFSRDYDAAWIRQDMRTMPDPPLTHLQRDRFRLAGLSADERETARARLVGRLIDLCESSEQPVDVVVAMAILLDDCAQRDKERTDTTPKADQ